MTTDSSIVAARREALRHWIDAHYNGKQSEFVRATGINQGELSGLLRRKSFREEKAINIEVKAGMPDGYLQRPTVPGSALKGMIRNTLAVAEPPPRYETGVSPVHTHGRHQAGVRAGPTPTPESLAAEVDSLREVVGILILSLVHNAPDAIERLVAVLRSESRVLPTDDHTLGRLLKRAEAALVARRESVGPPRHEPIQTCGSTPRRP